MTKNWTRNGLAAIGIAAVSTLALTPASSSAETSAPHTISTEAVLTAPGGLKSHSTVCPSGEKAIGGSYYLRQHTPYGDEEFTTPPAINGAYPFEDSGNGYIVYIDPQEDISITVWAICE
ncbi:MAG TPA: hypothetical protein VFX60_18225 [Micromonospora sp.]|nr:hypothetical protein [Micromonospora sp.]